ncbi:DUF655 domain-containing protein [Candidatus Nanopusillus massiliensis]|nr:DUF655 domain-containing protein [Candidatus Nanopusillus massiliensis]
MLIAKNEKKFVEFFNKAGPLNIRIHTLELFPDIGISNCSKNY